MSKYLFGCKRNYDKITGEINKYWEIYFQGGYSFFFIEFLQMLEKYLQKLEAFEKFIKVDSQFIYLFIFVSMLYQLNNRFPAC